MPSVTTTISDECVSVTVESDADEDALALHALDDLARTATLTALTTWRAIHDPVAEPSREA